MSDAAAVSPPASTARVLLIDDEAPILRTFRYCLEDDGHRVTTAQDSAQALAALARDVFDVCFLDLRLGNESGIELLPQLRSAAPWMRVVVATAHSSIDAAVEAMRAGAEDFLVKPCSPEQLRFVATRQMEARRVQARLESLEIESSAAAQLSLDSAAPSMAQLLDEARRVADTDASVLVLGESGTGKGVMARALHAWSHRSAGDLVTVNCPSLSAELLESELFGHAKGAFTGASESTQGRVAQADGGTLFLDEIGDFPLALQPKLLRFLQDKEYERVGDASTRRADVRIVAATNKNLDAMLADGSFRQDLLYRLNVITLRVPALRDRREDLQQLAERCLLELSGNYRRPARRFSEAALETIAAYAWPGNIRELRNVIERAVILAPGELIEPAHLSIANGSIDAEAELPRVGGRVTLESLERAHVQAVLASSATLEQAAQTLGIDVSTLYRKRRNYEVRAKQ
jgi:NtrC-family two-component system response regulator AlgB